MAQHIRDPLWWLLAALIALALVLPRSAPLFGALFPHLDRPVYAQESFVRLLFAHVELVALSSTISALVGVAIGIFVTRAAGREFRPLLQSIVAVGQTVPPVAVLAIAVPLIGFGTAPALIALALYGLLPVVHGTVSGLESVPPAVRDAATGMGMRPHQILQHVDLPLAAPLIVAGLRTSVIINIGTAAIASTVGVKTLGSPIIIGLTGFNTAYVIQGAVLVALLAMTTDQAFERLAQRLAPPR